MRNILTSTATAILLASSALAEGHAVTTYEFDEANDFFASNLIGMPVYTTEIEVEGDVVDVDIDVEWDNIGEIDDLIVSKDGEVQAAIIGVGGFLGVGERDVALSMDQIKVKTEADDTTERFLVVTVTKRMLEAAPVFERADDDTTTVTAVYGRPMLVRPVVEREGYTMTSIDQLTAEDLDGAYVYGPKDETVGEIGQLLLSDSGKIDQAVINVGGFLGLGEKPIAVTFEELQLLTNASGDLRVYIDATQEALEAQPEYEG